MRIDWCSAVLDTIQATLISAGDAHIRARSPGAPGMDQAHHHGTRHQLADDSSSKKDFRADTDCEFGAGVALVDGDFEHV